MALHFRGDYGFHEQLMDKLVGQVYCRIRLFGGIGTTRIQGQISLVQAALGKRQKIFKLISGNFLVLWFTRDWACL